MLYLDGCKQIGAFVVGAESDIWSLTIAVGSKRTVNRMFVISVLQITQGLENVPVLSQILAQQFFERYEHPCKVTDRLPIEIQFRVGSVIVLEIH